MLLSRVQCSMLRLDMSIILIKHWKSMSVYSTTTGGSNMIINICENVILCIISDVIKHIYRPML